MRRPLYDTPEHGAEVAIFAILILIFGVLLGLYNLSHRMSADMCCVLGLMSCSNIFISEQDTPAGNAIRAIQKR